MYIYIYVYVSLSLYQFICIYVIQYHITSYTNLHYVCVCVSLSLSLSLSLYTYIYIYIYVYIYIYTHVCVCVYIYIYIYKKQLPAVQTIEHYASFHPESLGNSGCGPFDFKTLIQIVNSGNADLEQFQFHFIQLLAIRTACSAKSRGKALHKWACDCR